MKETIKKISEKKKVTFDTLNENNKGVSLEQLRNMKSYKDLFNEPSSQVGYIEELIGFDISEVNIE